MTVEITVGQAARIITFLNADEGGSASLNYDNADTPGDLGGSGSKSQGTAVASARDALDISGAKTNPEKIVALGQYVMQDGGDTFKVEDVKTQFRRARETPPANFTRDLSVAVKEGWLAVGADGEYYVTNKIDGVFDSGFKFPKSASGGDRVRRAAKAAKEKPESFSEIDEFPTRMKGVAAYAKMKSEGNRVLWALLFAKNRGIKGLSNKDVAWLTDHLGVGVPSANTAGAVRGPRASGYLNRSTTDKTLRITEDGETYLKSFGAES